MSDLNNLKKNEFFLFYFCVRIDEPKYNKKNFKINFIGSSSYFLNSFKYEVYEYEENKKIKVIEVYIINPSVLDSFMKKYKFNISYISEEKVILNCENNFLFKSSNIIFQYDIKNSLNQNLIYNISKVEQFKAFNSTINKSLFDDLFNNTLELLKKNLDLELFLFMYQTYFNKRNDLLDIFNNFPKFIITYSNFKEYKIYLKTILENNKHNNIDYLKSIYFTIIDYQEIEKYFKKDFIEIIIKYNKSNKDSPIYIQKNMFNMFISRASNEIEIKNICKSCQSIPIFFQYLENHKENKISNLTHNDIPKISPNDDVIELIKKTKK